MNFIKEQFAVWRLKQNLRTFTRPDRAFLKLARTRFITLVQQRASVQVRTTRHLPAFKYATVAIVAVLSMTSGLSVFADANNVPITHPLYNLKRASEQVRLGLSTPAQQVELHRIFAHRRLEEASELENENNIQPTLNQIQDQRVVQDQNQIKIRSRIDSLDQDFQNEMENGLNQAQKSVDHPEVRTQLCNDILDTIQNKPMGRKLPGHMVDRIKSRCDNQETIKEDSGD